MSTAMKTEELTREDVVEAICFACAEPGVQDLDDTVGRAVLQTIEDLGLVLMSREVTETERRAVIDAMDNPTNESPPVSGLGLSCCPARGFWGLPATTQHT